MLPKKRRMEDETDVNRIRMLDVVEYAAKRPRATAEAVAAIQSDGVGPIPRAQRRRTSSHRRRVLPVQERLALGAKKGKKPPNRANSRYPRELREKWLAERQSSEVVERHLPSHFWLSKRAHMEHRFGWVLPVCAASHGVKAGLRAAGNGCLVWEESWMESLFVEGVGRVGEFGLGEEKVNLFGSDCRVLRCGGLDRGMVWVHPLDVVKVCEGLEGVGCVVKRDLGRVGRWGLRGPRAWIVLSQMWGCGSGGNSSLEGVLERKEEGVCIALEIPDPRRSGLGGKGEVGEVVDLESSRLWEVEHIDACVSELGTEEEVGVERRLHLESTLKSESTPPKKLPTIPIWLIRTTASYGTKGIGNGWDVVAPMECWRMVLQGAVEKGGALFGGLREMEGVLTASGCRIYPNDYPTTTHGKSHWNAFLEHRLATDQARPPRIRHRPAPIRGPLSLSWDTVCPSPIETEVRTPSQWTSLTFTEPNCIVAGTLRMSSGSMETGAAIFLPLKSDIVAWNEAKEEFRGIPETPGTETDHSPTRRCIGFVTSSVRSEPANAFLGQGAITTTVIPHLLNPSNRPLQAIQSTRKHKPSTEPKPTPSDPTKGIVLYVLVRQMTSNMYRPSSFRIQFVI